MTQPTTSNALPRIFPKKEQAIVMDYVQQSKLDDYLRELSKIIEPAQITFASPIPNNKICIYLSSKEIVDNLIIQKKKITIDNTDVTIRRLISPAQKIIIKNVQPYILNEIIEEKLEEIGIKTVSPIQFLGTEIQDKWPHVLSFNRSVYIAPNTISLPVGIRINYDETEHKIFLSEENKMGHQTAICPAHTINQKMLHQQAHQLKKL